MRKGQQVCGTKLKLTSATLTFITSNKHQIAKHKPVAPGDVSLVNGKFRLVDPFSNVLTSPQSVGSGSSKPSGILSIIDLNGEISSDWSELESAGPLFDFFGVE